MMNYDVVITEADAIREWVREVGPEYPDREWLVTNYDTIERNPFHRGSSQPHPYEESESLA